MTPARLVLNYSKHISPLVRPTTAALNKLEFHGTDTDTNTFGSIVARMSVCCPYSLPQLAVSCGSAAHLSWPDTHEDPRRLVCRLVRYTIFLARILTRMSTRNARVHTSTCVLYTISYRVHVYKIT